MARRLRSPDARYADAPASPAGAYGHEMPPERDVPPGREVPPGLLRPRNGAGRAALVCGVLALICAIGFFLLITVPVAVLLGLAAIVLGILGRSRVRRGLATNRGSATTGIVTGLLSLLILAGLVVGGVAVVNATRNNSDVKALKSCSRSAGFDLNAQRACVDQYRNRTGK